MQVPAFQAGGLEVVGIAGRNPERTRGVAGELGIASFDTWQEMLERSGADWLSIVTPPSEHCEMAIAALAMGKHVLCEKPTAMDADEAGRMLAAARAASRRCAIIDHELRFLPTWREARGLIEGLGEIRFLEIRYASPGRSDPQRDWNWWSDAGRGGGVWGAVGSHMIDAVRYLAGEIDAVSATLDTTIRRRPLPGGGQRDVTSDDTVSATLRLRSGAMVLMTLSVVATVDEETTITLHGSDAGLRLRGHSLELAPRSGGWETVSTTPQLGSAGNSPGGPFGTGTHHLARAIAAASASDDWAALAPAATFEDGLAQQRVLDAGRESSRRGGGWVEVAQRT